MQVIVVGGGISGLVTAIQLVRAGIHCSLIEKRNYPFHRVCGEYISNETIPFLKATNLFPEAQNPPVINRFHLSSVRGKNVILPLDLGGFGISRYTFDHFLYKCALNEGVNFFLKEEVEKISFDDQRFYVMTKSRQLEADIVVGAFGKRSKIDIELGRTFIKKRSPYVGVKYHIKTDHANDLIALHNFSGGYCGISNVEDGKTNLCYLTHRENIRRFKSIREMEQAVLFENPFLKNIFANSQFLFEKPETINEISFETKLPVEDHILMTGDAAGMITPLCGNGMAMAIHSAKIASDLIIKFARQNKFSRAALEQEYSESWNRIFSKRLWFGRQVQKLFGIEWASDLAVNLAITIRPVARAIIKGTHGDPF
ncbi:MAG TPA: NAD(P)/FAD-dependent oxidoreductase [Chryseolinea sp.]